MDGARRRVTAFALKGLLGRKLRTALTAIAIVLGVAMVTGTYILTDSIKGAFDGIFTEIYSGTDATSPASPRSTSPTRRQHDGAAVRRVAARQGARRCPTSRTRSAASAARRSSIGRERQGDRLRRRAEPRLQRRPGQARVQPADARRRHVADGERGRHRPVDGEARRTSRSARRSASQANGPVQQMRISGLVKFGGASSLGGATLAGFDLADGADALREAGQARPDPREGEAGRSRRSSSRRDPERSCRRGRRCGPARRRRAEDAKDTESFLNFLQDFLLAFGGIALFVGSFVIANSLSITIAQRTRELATLRTLGASRRQVLTLDHRRGARDRARSRRSSASSSASGSATGLFKLFDAVGFTLPNNGLVAADAHGRRRAARRHPRHARSRACGRRSARRACRRSRPCARARRCRRVALRALPLRRRAIAAHARSASPRSRTGSSDSGLGTTQILVYMGLGTLLIFFGVALLSSRFARPLARAARLARDEDRRRRRRARARQRAAQPAAHRVDRVRADDRARARHARRGARGRDHEELQGRRQRPLDERLRDHGGEQLLTDPDRGRRGRGEDARRRGDRERARRRRAGLRAR